MAIFLKCSLKKEKLKNLITKTNEFIIKMFLNCSGNHRSDIKAFDDFLLRAYATLLALLGWK